MGRLRHVAVALILLAIVPSVASAHEISGRFEAPLPLSLLFGGAAVTVAITAIILAFTVEETPGDVEGGFTFSISPPMASGLRITIRSVFFILFLLTVVTGSLGKQVPAENFATVFIWAVWLKGIAIIAALLGSPWRLLSPWRTLYAGLTHVEGKPIAVVGEYPAWLGVLPALGWYLLWIGVVENLTVIPRSPNATALLVIVYTVVMVGGGIAFGPQWFRNADALSVLYRLFGRVAPLTATRTDASGYRIRIHSPWRECIQPVRGLAVTAFVIATVYTVSFDGFTSTPEFQTLLFGIRNTFGVGSSVSVLLYLGGFVGFIAIFLAIIGFTQWAASEATSEWQATTIAFAPTILPIAVAYEIAHNYPFVLGNAGQLLAVLWPFFDLGQGPTIDLLGWLTLPIFWWSQVILIVAGHIVAVIAAHYVALSQYETAQKARRAHIPLIVLMVGYTVLSLWIISRPVVTG